MSLVPTFVELSGKWHEDPVLIGPNFMICFDDEEPPEMVIYLGRKAIVSNRVADRFVPSMLGSIDAKTVLDKKGRNVTGPRQHVHFNRAIRKTPDGGTGHALGVYFDFDAAVFRRVEDLIAWGWITLKSRAVFDEPPKVEGVYYPKRTDGRE